MVDAGEVTQSLLQEIYDKDGKLIARHQKYPVDTGHQTKIEGKERLRAYFARGVSPESTLHFTLLQALAGVDSVTIYFRRHDGVEVAEVSVFDATGYITQVRVHYSAASIVWQP